MKPWALTLSAGLHAVLLPLVVIDAGGAPREVPARSYTVGLVVLEEPVSTAQEPAEPASPVKPQPQHPPPREPAWVEPEPAVTELPAEPVAVEPVLLAPPLLPPPTLPGLAPGGAVEPPRVLPDVPDPVPDRAPVAPSPPAPVQPPPPRPRVSAAPRAPRAVAYTPPRYLDRPQPRYPRQARRLHLEGTTILRVRVRTDGTVGKVEIVQSSGHQLLDREAIRCVSACRFHPARRGLAVVEGDVEVPIGFQLQ